MKINFEHLWDEDKLHATLTPYKPTLITRMSEPVRIECIQKAEPTRYDRIMYLIYYFSFYIGKNPMPLVKGANKTCLALSQPAIVLIVSQ